MTENEAIRRIRYRIDTASEIAGKGAAESALEDMYIAILALKEIQQYREIGTVEDIKQAIGILSLSENDIVETFHELNEYRKIGTVEECRKAVEKQRPKKPKELDTEYGYFICGNCGGAMACTDDFKTHKYCLNCGQAIQWEESEEE